MQRKLSEIAEIPKILSSTLETVSQTFDKLVPPLSYHEDDESCQRNYFSDELMESDLSDDEDEEVIQKAKRKYESGKDNTPESDYVSGTFYGDNEGDYDDEEEDDDYDDDDEDEEDYEDDYEVGDDDEYDKNEETDEYLWNTKNIPQLRVNNGEQEEEEEKEEELKMQDVVNTEEDCPEAHVVTAEDLIKQEKQEKIDKLERSWPWADREKIIYKQSTCHLVPRQPLGLVENRIKLLAKQNLIGIYEKNLEKLK